MSRVPIVCSVRNSLCPLATVTPGPEYELQQHAKKRLELILPVVFFVIFLHVVFRSVAGAAMLFFPAFFVLMVVCCCNGCWASISALRSPLLHGPLRHCS